MKILPKNTDSAYKLLVPQQRISPIAFYLHKYMIFWLWTPQNVLGSRSLFRISKNCCFCRGLQQNKVLAICLWFPLQKPKNTRFVDFVFSLLRNPLQIHKKYSSDSQCLVGSGWEPREDLGGWGRTLLLRAPPLADPKGPLLYYLELSIFGWLTLKFFSKRFRRQHILILMEERAPKKCDFLNEKFPDYLGLV